MSPSKNSTIRGTLDLLILKAIRLEPLHGVGIFQRIDQMTQGAVQVSYGSLFPALHRMEQKRWLRATWDSSDNGRKAKYYELTKTGRAQLERETKHWAGVVKAVAAALRSN